MTKGLVIVSAIINPIRGFYGQLQIAKSLVFMITSSIRAAMDDYKLYKAPSILLLILYGMLLIEIILERVISYMAIYYVLEL